VPQRLVAEAEVFAEKIRANVASLQIEHLKIGAASLGLIRIHANEIDNRDGIYAEADKFLYQAIPSTHDKRESR